MDTVHQILGFTVVGVFALGWVWGLGAKLARRGPGELYWRWVAVAQVVAGVQVVIGIVLLISGARPDADGLAQTLHYVYGALPLVLFAIAHVAARIGNLSILGIQRRDGSPIPIQPWTPFAWASFISFGLTLRALMTGLGVG